ncbi:uncharacterized protein F5147DRAFT_777094 [Suillus discolor]|uniref:Uncharacterized protein n=1 Tax=Suillus discolor TaxID=1912936 RepID=A0A9P7F1J5_9AGAM|nr:uncharacterized protein F5147DRAFT_777094 [Suillus discolor]KAG2100187.1 hypothetical protein F5147DRAFT_777094 [Suillus discolor]
MAIPPEVANDALNDTLAVVQSLMKWCIKVKEGDPEALRLSDEIARRVAKDLKLYSGDATSFSPQLLSFATVVRQHSKAGAFENVPDWTSITNDDPRIQSHPRFEKTVHYCPPSTLSIPAIATSTDIPATAPTTPALIVPPSAASTPPSMPSHTVPGLVTKPAVEPKRSLQLRSCKNPPVLARFSTGPPARFLHLYMSEAEKKQFLEAGGSNKRKAEDQDADGAVVVANKKRKSKSDVEQEPTGVIYAPNSLPLQELPPVATDKDVPLVADKGFRDVEARVCDFSDSDVATPWQHSVRYHPRQCDKCAKLDIACLVLHDKKFGYTRLACANCDNKKITCAIDGVGVRQRLQGKAAKASSDAPKGPKKSKSRAVSKTLAAHPSRSQWSIVVHEGAEKKPMEVLPGRPQMQPEHGQSAPTNLLEPEPTAREILQGIQDLGRRLDLLAANEQVDALEVRVGSVETNLLKWLDKLEQRLNESDAWCKSLESLG